MIYVADPDFTLHLGDVRECLRELPDASVDCVVTSPPYADARDDNGPIPPAVFPQWLAGILEATRRVLTENGSVMLNLGRVFRDGEELPYVEETVRVLRAVGWKKLDEVIWYKPNAPARSGPYLTNAHEYAFWFARHVAAYRGLDGARSPYAPSTLGRYGRRWARNTRVKGSHVEQSGRTPHPLGARPTSVVVETVGREKGNPHPTPMPLKVAEYLVALACPAGGTVLDLFGGSGTTALAARKLDRRAILIEREEKWCALAAERLEPTVVARRGRSRMTVSGGRWNGPLPNPSRPLAIGADDVSDDGNRTSSLERS